MRQKSNSPTLFVFDLLVIYACFLGVFLQYKGWAPIPLRSVLLVVFVGLLWFVIAYSSSVTNVNANSKLWKVLQDTLVAYSVLTAGIIAAVAIFDNFAPNNKLVLYPMLFAWMIASGFRFTYLITIRHVMRNGYQRKSVLLIGGNRLAERVIRQIANAPELGYRLHGILAEDYFNSMPQEYYLGKLGRFAEIIRSNLIDEVIIALPLRMGKTITELVDECENEGIRVRIVLDFFPAVRSRMVMDDLGEIPLIGIRHEPLCLLRNRFVKRCFDIAFSLCVLILLSPLFLVLAFIIKLFSPGPVFFKQKRVGHNNVEFEIYKFRSMVVQEEKRSDTIWTMESDPRVTRVGAFVRKTGLDELPQFWNVLVGNMSVVGPRPERKHFVEQFKQEIHCYKVRHFAKSGITGWAQVNGWRGDTSIRERVEHDIYYIENWNLWLDIKIIWATVFGRGAYQNAY